MTPGKTILITGGTGLVGKHLHQQLLVKGYNIKILSSNESACNGINTFYWNINTGFIDKRALENVNYIVHLAGANIAQKRWTAAQKQNILDSRIKSIQLLLNTIDLSTNQLSAVVSSSATGYYGAYTSEKIYHESDAAAEDFLGHTCFQWENSVNQFHQLKVRTVVLRTGVVFAKGGGALEKLKMFAKFGLSAAFGTGKQYFPWIHIHDLCAMYIKAIEDNTMHGAYNAVAPQHINNKDFTIAFAKSLRKPYFLPNVPAFVLKTILGEMAVMLLEGSRISCKKIQNTGFDFKFKDCEEALRDLIV
jgi:uncharacterized protein (TIGR01777 family)